MAETRHGRDGLILKHSGDITQDIYGEESGTCTFQVPPGSWDIMPGAGFEHPQATHMLFERRKVKFSPGFWLVSCDFRGVNGDPPPQYELVYGSGSEPIETHPDFESKIGGKPSAPKNGAIFVGDDGNKTTDDAAGIFDRFLIKNPDDPATSFAGIDAYVDMNNIMWTKIEIPEGGAPTFEGRNWLYLGLSSGGVRGASARHRQTWRLSGPNGWNPKMYST
jgi:hypothetical protein